MGLTQRFVDYYPTTLTFTCLFCKGDWIPRRVWPLYENTMDKPISEGRKTIERSLRGLPLLTVFSEEWARLDWNYTTMKWVSCEGKAMHRAAGTTSAVCAITGAGEKWKKVYYYIGLLLRHHPEQ